MPTKDAVKKRAKSPEKKKQPIRRYPPTISKKEIEKNFGNMYHYILDEAYEKAAEIDVRTDEEYKSSIKSYIEKETNMIDKEFKAKEAIVATKTETFYSVKKNMSKLSEINAKHDQLSDLKEKVKKFVANDMEDPSKYRDIIKLLIIEGLYKLLEPIVIVTCKQKDVEIVKSTFKDCEDIYNIKTKKKTKLFIHKSKYLPQTYIGGVKLESKNGKITLLNTLDDRLEQVFANTIPAIISAVFKIKIHVFRK